MLVFLLIGLLFITRSRSDDETLVDINICLLNAEQFDAYTDCLLNDGNMTSEFRREYDDLMSKFPGMKMSELASLICKASNDDGEAVLEQFMEAMSPPMQKEFTSLINLCVPMALEIRGK